MKTDLLPCPFCGTAPEIQPWHGGPRTKRLIGCENEGCPVMPQVTGDTEEKAVLFWNRRAPDATEEEVARAADKVMRDWELACRDHPVNYAKPETLHPFGPAIGWQSLHLLRDALAKRGEEGE